jgi:hypothetical protein
MSVLKDLQNWYESQCGKNWEDQFGVEIGTLDNPGWEVAIDLADTGLESKAFQEIKSLGDEKDWIRCWVEGKRFHGVGGPQKLEEILGIFLEWAKEG